MSPGLQGKDDTGKAIQDYWKPSLTLLADKDLIAKLKSYDKDNISPKWVTSLADNWFSAASCTHHC